MAITPQQALGNKIIEKRALIREAEDHFDKELRANFDGTSSVTIEFPSQYHSVRSDIVSIYEKKHWVVNGYSSPYNESFLVFAPKAPNAT